MEQQTNLAEDGFPADVLVGVHPFPGRGKALRLAAAPARARPTLVLGYATLSEPAVPHGIDVLSDAIDAVAGRSGAERPDESGG